MKLRLIIFALFIISIGCQDNKAKKDSVTYIELETKILQEETDLLLRKAKKITEGNPPKFKLYKKLIESLEKDITALTEAIETGKTSIDEIKFDHESLSFFFNSENQIRIFKEGIRNIQQPVVDYDKKILEHQIEKLRNKLISIFFYRYFKDEDVFNFNLIKVQKIHSTDKASYNYTIVGIDTTRQDFIRIEGVEEAIKVKDGLGKIPVLYKGKKATYFYTITGGKPFDFSFEVGR